MKYLVILSLCFSLACSKSSSTPAGDPECGTIVVSGATLKTYKGTSGGCYYTNSAGNKSYVDQSNCPKCP